MKVFITGGTGFVGKAVVQSLLRNDHEVTVLTRSIPQGQPQPRSSRFQHLEGDPRAAGTWQEKVAELKRLLAEDEALTAAFAVAEDYARDVYQRAQALPTQARKSDA